MIEFIATFLMGMAGGAAIMHAFMADGQILDEPTEHGGRPL